MLVWRRMRVVMAGYRETLVNIITYHTLLKYALAGHNEVMV